MTATQKRLLFETSKKGNNVIAYIYPWMFTTKTDYNTIGDKLNCQQEELFKLLVSAYPAKRTLSFEMIKQICEFAGVDENKFIEFINEVKEWQKKELSEKV